MLKFRFEDYKDKNINFDSFLCKDGCIVYKIIRKPEAKLFIEYIEEENLYVVTCNKSITKQELKQYVMNNYQWILNWYKNVDDPSPWMLFGQKIPVHVVIGDKHHVEYLGNQINVYLRHKRDYKLAVKQFYKEVGYAYLMPRTQELINKLGLKGSFGQVKWVDSYYGLCHCDNNTIDFTSKLMQYPKDFIDSVIYHEIAHFTHHNHKKAFWQLLKTYCPNYYELDRQALHLQLSNHVW